MNTLKIHAQKKIDSKCFKYIGHSSPIHIIVPDPLLGDVNRKIRIFVPADYDKDVPLPLVMDYHGFTYKAQWQVNNCEYCPS